MKEEGQEHKSPTNVIIKSRYGFSRMEKNAIYSIISKVRKEYIEQPGDLENCSNMIVAIEEKKLMGKDDENGKEKEETIDGLAKLRHRDVSVEREDGSRFNCGFINWVQYFPDSKVYKLEVSSLVIPYLAELAKRYDDNYSLTVAISLKSKWSQKIYELCYNHRKDMKDGTTSFFIGYWQLRSMLNLYEGYPRLIDFKRRVIEASVKEIKQAFDNNQSDLWFDCVERYVPSKGTDFVFIVFNRDYEEPKC